MRIWARLHNGLNHSWFASFISLCCWAVSWHLLIIIYNFRTSDTLNHKFSYYNSCFLSICQSSDQFWQFSFGCLADHVPVALTLDYGGPVVRYADGVVDLHLNRYITVREGRRPIQCWLQLIICNSHPHTHKTHLFSDSGIYAPLFSPSRITLVIFLFVGQIIVKAAKIQPQQS